MQCSIAATMLPWVSPVMGAVAGAAPYPMWPLSVCNSTTTSSIACTVRTAVLNGVFRGTRTMPSRKPVIFIMCPLEKPFECG